MASSDSRFWHPFADMHAIRSAELTLVSGDGVHVTDEDGRRYLDGTASLWNVNVGHGRTELADAAAAQMRELATYGAFGAFNNRPRRELTDRLADLAPGRRRAHLPHQRRRRLDRHRGQARAALLRRHRPARARAPDLALAGLPRHARARHEPRRHPRQPRRRRPARPQRLAGAARLARGARGRDRARRRRPRGGRVRRAGDRRRRRAPAARRATSRASTRCASAPACCTWSTR